MPPAKSTLPGKPSARDIKLAAAIVTQLDEDRTSGTAQYGPQEIPCGGCDHGQHAHAGAQRTGRCNTTGCSCRSYREDIPHRLAMLASEGFGRGFRDDVRRVEDAERITHPRPKREPGQWSIGPSDYLKCRRQIAYRNIAPDDFVPDPTYRGEAILGGIIEGAWVERMRKLYPWREYQVRVTIEGLDTPKFLDVYDPITGELIEIKTAGDWRWSQVGNDGPAPEWMGQVGMYAEALERTGCRISVIRLHVIQRGDAAEEQFVFPWDDTFRKLAAEAREWLLSVATMFDLGIMPDRDRSGPTTDMLCKRCFARSHCWNIPRAEQIGRSPESLTVLGEQPLDEDVAWAIEQYIALAKDAREAKARAEEAYHIVGTLPVGTYGGMFEVRPGRAGGTNWQQYHKLTVEHYENPTPGVTLADIPVPKDSRARNTVGRVRAAKRAKAKPEPATPEQAATETTEEGAA